MTWQRSTGFILPSVLALSLAVIIVMVSLFSLTSASYKDSTTDYYQKLADEAAEAGTAYAAACLNISTHVQTWGPAAGQNNLAPNTNCNGANSYASNLYVYSDSTVRTTFSVGNLDYSTQFSAQISSTGTVELLRSDGTVSKTMTSIKKRSISWPTEVVGEMSASGTNRTCAIVNGQVYCWGYNAYGQLGDGRYLGAPNNVESSSSIDSVVPVKVHQATGVMAGKRIAKIFVAQYHTCALSTDGRMYCWGQNASGQLGTGNTTDSAVPIQVGGALAGQTVTDISGTSNTTCAIANSKFYCWGTNTNGLTGRNTNSGMTLTPTLVTASNTATTLPTNYSATSLATSGSRSRTICGIADGKAYCWGQNTVGSVGNGSSGGSVLVPTKVLDTGALAGRTVTAISIDGFYGDPTTTGYSHACAIASGALFCWGENNSGQLGDGSTTVRNAPVPVTATGVLSGKTIQDIQVGLRHSCAQASNGVYCWGQGAGGQLGHGSFNDSSLPVAVTTAPGAVSSSNVISIGAGANRGCAVISDGRTFCWGVNTNGQIGDGTTTNRNVPTESLFLRPLGNQFIY